MKWFRSKKKKERGLKNLKESMELMDKAVECSNVDMAFTALLAGMKAAKDLGFDSLSEARKYYNV